MTASGLAGHCVQRVRRCPKAHGGGPAGNGAVSLTVLHFWPCIMVRGPVEERKKNPELVAGYND